MSTVDVVMPQMGVSVSEGTVSRWMKAVGETIEKDETLLEISTDKVDTEVPSPAAGVVTEILAEEGDTLDVGARLAVIATDGAGAAPAAVAEPAAPAAPEPVAAPPVAAPAPVAPAPVAPAPVVPAAVANGNGAAPAAVPGRFVSPVVARIAAEHGVDVNAIPGSGAGGRVTKKDIMSFLAGGAPAAAPAAVAAVPAPAVPAAAPVAPAPAAAPPQGFTGGEQVVNFNPMRKAIARHMRESIDTSAHVTSTIEVDMTNVANMRAAVKGELAATWGVKVTFTHFVIRALIDAVAHYPLVNAEIRGDSAVIKNYMNLGVAVALDGGEGLIVPVVKNAEEKNLVGIARAVNDLADRARSKKLGPDDVVGGTFTLTNPGVFGTIHGTPIINQPQVAILDTEAIVKRPWVLTDAQGNDSIAIRSIMNLALSYDHRLIDGAYAAQFLAHLRRNLETWDYARFLG